jgi:hypothetical protein
MVVVEKEKERTRRFETPLGTLLVWTVVKSDTHGIAGYHFMLKGADGREDFFTDECGGAFSRVSFYSAGQQVNIMLEEEESDPYKARFLRTYWEEYIEGLVLYAI